MNEKTVTYEVTCRTYAEDGGFLNAETIYVEVPENLSGDEDGEDFLEYLKEACADEMEARCDEGESWEMSEWGIA